MATKTSPESAESVYLECYGIERRILAFVAVLQGSKKSVPVSSQALESTVQADRRDPDDCAPPAEMILDGIQLLRGRRWLSKRKGGWLITELGRAALGIEHSSPRQYEDAADDMDEVVEEKEVDSERLRESTELILSTLDEVRHEPRFQFDPRVNSAGEVPDYELLKWAMHKGVTRKQSNSALGQLLLRRRISIAITISCRLITARDSSSRGQDAEAVIPINATGACDRAIIDLLLECEQTVEDRIRRIPAEEQRDVERAPHLLTPFPSYGLPRMTLETALSELFQQLNDTLNGLRESGLGCPGTLQRELAECIQRFGQEDIGDHFGALPFPEAGPSPESIVSLLDANRIKVSSWLPKKIMIQGKLSMNPYWGPVFRLAPSLRPQPHLESPANTGTKESRDHSVAQIRELTGLANAATSVLTEEHYDILHILAKSPHGAMLRVEIEAAISRSKGVVRSRVNELGGRGLVAAPDGVTRKGVGITEEGKQLLKKHDDEISERLSTKP